MKNHLKNRNWFKGLESEFSISTDLSQLNFKCTIITVLMFTTILLSTQINGQSPITPTNGFVGKSEVLIFWEGFDGDTTNATTFSHNLLSLKKDYELYPPQEYIDRYTENKMGKNYGNGIINGSVGDFNSDGIDDYVVVSHTDGDGFKLNINIVDSFLIDTSIEISVQKGPHSEYGYGLTGNVLVEAGDFNGDKRDDIAVGYLDEEDYFNLLLFTLDTTNTIQLKKEFVSEKVLTNSYNDNIAIAVKNLHADEKDEIILGFATNTPDTMLRIKVYGFGETPFEPVERAETGFRDSMLNELGNEALTINLTSGDFNGDSINDIALGISSDGEVPYLHLFPIQVFYPDNNISNNTIDSLSFDQDNFSQIELGWNPYPISISSGDVNGNGKDEILIGSTSLYLYYSSGSSLKLDYKNLDVSTIYSSSFKFTDIQNFDNDNSNGNELLILNDLSGSLELYVYQVDGDYNTDLFASEGIGTSYGEAHSYFMLAGDFDGDVFKIGPGKKYIKTEIIQPLVILNAPPTHFDMFGENIYDVNNCYNDNNCASYATYTKSTSETLAISTTLRETWGTSATLKGGKKILGFGVESYLTAEYGKHFEKSSGSSSTVQVNQSITASEDDLLYATVCDYEIWEYPVYSRGSKKMGNIITLKPKLTENQWFPSKERSAAGYVPKHEVGNILSYTPFTELDNPDIDDKIRGSYSSDSYLLNESSNINYSVTLSNTFNTSETVERNIGVEAGASVSYGGIEVEGEGHYSRDDISTHSMEINNALNISVHLGGINRSFGETNYIVTPYIYWANSGAMVIDYAVRPNLPEAGGTDTWWSANYNIPDPAFILPWRLDPEKGLAIEDETKRTRTKSIYFLPKDPKPGDVITTTAIINNLSVYPTDEQVPVSFYIGNPYAGGTLITGIDGKTKYYTSDVIVEQGYNTVTMTWILPDNLESFPRIYGVIDPDNELQNEVHEENNLGWAILGSSEENGTTGLSEDLIADFGGKNFSVAYPNPVRGTGKIAYKLDKPSQVNIVLYNLQGQLVKTLFTGYRPSGKFETNLGSEGLTPGIYTCIVKTNNKMDSHKIIILE